MNRGSLITPDAPCIATLEINWTSSPYYNGPYDNTTIQGQLEELQDIHTFLYNASDSWLTYEYDFFQYPGIFDHLPTPEEVLANRMDDCDGIALVTVSLLVRLGYEAYVAESDSHWWTYVKIYGEDLDSNVTGKTYTIVYLNWWDGIGEPYMIFNQTTVIITQPLFYSWYQQMMDGYYITIIQEYGLPFVGFVPVVAVLVGFLFSFGVGFPRKYQKKRMHLANATLASVVLGALLVILLFLPANLLSYGTLILFGTVGVLAFIIERDYLTRRIWKPEK